MPRIPYPDPDSLPDEDRKFLASLPQLNISRLLAGSPSMFRPMTRLFSAYLSDGLLDPVMREIVILRVGHLRESEYEVVNHERVAKLINMSSEQIAGLALGGDQSVFSDVEKIVIKFVDEVVRDGGASEETFAALAEHMSAAEMIEVTAVAGVYVMVSQICATFDIEVEETPIANTGIEEIKASVARLDKS
jgi:4-carboxymuconolactone decarboxylase